MVFLLVIVISRLLLSIAQVSNVSSLYHDLGFQMQLESNRHQAKL